MNSFGQRVMMHDVSPLSSSGVGPDSEPQVDGSWSRISLVLPKATACSPKKFPKKNSSKRSQW